MTPIWAWFGYDEPNYTYMPDGRKLLSELAALSPGAGLRAHAQSAHDRRRHAALKWGSTNAYTRGRQRQADLRLDDRRPHLRHLSRARDEAAGARSASCPRRCRPTRSPYRHVWKPGDGYNRHLHRLELSAERLREVGRAGLRSGSAHSRREVRPGGSRELVVGSLERARHRLLARHARGIPEAVRLRRRRR